MEQAYAGSARNCRKSSFLFQFFWKTVHEIWNEGKGETDWNTRYMVPGDWNNIYVSCLRWIKHEMHRLLAIRIPSVWSNPGFSPSSFLPSCFHSKSILNSKLAFSAFWERIDCQKRGLRLKVLQDQKQLGSFNFKYRPISFTYCQSLAYAQAQAHTLAATCPCMQTRAS